MSSFLNLWSRVGKNLEEQKGIYQMHLISLLLSSHLVFPTSGKEPERPPDGQPITLDPDTNGSESSPTIFHIWGCGQGRHMKFCSRKTASHRVAQLLVPT